MRYLTFLFAILVLVTGCNKRTTIINNVTERDANEIIVLLASKNIQAEKIAAPAATAGGGSSIKLWDITVPPSSITESLAILNQSGLPRVKGTNLLDLFGSQGLVPSDLQDRIRYQEGLSAQLANTIRKMDGIIDANVQITMPKDDDDQDAEDLTASIYIKHRGVLDNPNSILINKIKRLVSSALPGLTPDNVSVVADRVTFTDLSFGDSDHPFEQQGLIKIWGVKIAKESAMLFRLIFYAFILLLFVALSIIVWIGWKIYPIIETEGVQSLISLDPYTPEKSEPKIEDDELNADTEEPPFIDKGEE